MNDFWNKNEQVNCYQSEVKKDTYEHATLHQNTSETSQRPETIQVKLNRLSTKLVCIPVFVRD